MKLEKELSDISWQVSEETYRQDPALSYSTLAKYEREGFDKLGTLFEQVSSPSLTEGSMVDCLITGSNVEFEQQFYVADFPSVGDKELQVVNYLFTQFSNDYSNMEAIPATYILNAANIFEFQKNWKDETRVKVLTERCSDYYKLKYYAGNRTIVNQETFYKVQAMVRALKESPSTCGYFKDNDEDSPVRRYYQLKFKATFDGIPYRCMADEIITDYDKKEIYLIDLKTSSKPEWNFYKSFVEWRYDIQARLYYRIITANLAVDPYFKDFKVHNYRFIVVNKQTLKPLVWKFKDTKSMGELNYGKNKQITLRDPFKIGEELQDYLNCKPEVPKGVYTTSCNDIVNFLNSM